MAQVALTQCPHEAEGQQEPALAGTELNLRASLLPAAQAQPSKRASLAPAAEKIPVKDWLGFLKHAS